MLPYVYNNIFTEKKNTHKVTQKKKNQRFPESRLLSLLPGDESPLVYSGIDNGFLSFSPSAILSDTPCNSCGRFYKESLKNFMTPTQQIENE